MRTRFAELAKIGYDCYYLTYLTTSKKQLIVLEIDKTKKIYKSISACPSEILDKANRNFIYSEAGYAVDIHRQFKSTTSCDILLLSTNLLASSPVEIDTILLHELAHWLINSYQPMPIITPEANQLGENIFGRTDKSNVKATQHTLKFCNLLAQGCIEYNRTTSNFSTDMACVESAMRFDIDFE